MSFDLDELRSVLAEHAGDAPDNPDRLPQVHRRVRRARRARAVMAVAAVAVVGVAGGVVVPRLAHLPHASAPPAGPHWPIKTIDGLPQYTSGDRLVQVVRINIARTHAVSVPLARPVTGRGIGYAVQCTHLRGAKGHSIWDWVAVAGGSFGGTCSDGGNTFTSSPALQTVRALRVRLSSTRHGGLLKGVSGFTSVGLYVPIPWADYPIQPRPDHVQLNVPSSDLGEGGPYVLRVEAREYGVDGRYTVGRVRVTRRLTPILGLTVPGQLTIYLGRRPWLSCSSYTYGGFQCQGQTVSQQFGHRLLGLLGRVETVKVWARHFRDPGWAVGVAPSFP